MVRRWVAPLTLLLLRPLRRRSGCPRSLRHARGERGSAIVEFALASMVLLTLVFGVIAIAMALYAYHFVSDAAREGTRYAINRGSSCLAYSGFTSACPAIESDVQSYVRGLAFPGINPSLMDVYTTWPTTGSTCTPSPAPYCNNPGNLVQVTVRYHFPLTIPFIPAETLTMTSSSEMVISD